MSTTAKNYCLDTNVLIQAWQKYYSPKLCPSYWELLNDLGLQGRIFIAAAVFDEIARTEDDLLSWLKAGNIPVRKINEEVTNCLRQIYAKDSTHKLLVDNTKARSLADPWVIAHAMNEGAVVVTKEEKITVPNSAKIKIPNVCDNMGVPWIDDFKFVSEMNIRFICEFAT